LPSPYKPNLQNDKYKFFDPELADQPKEVKFSALGAAGEGLIAAKAKNQFEGF
jgi:hypothetical protein